MSTNKSPGPVASIAIKLLSIISILQVFGCWEHVHVLRNLGTKTPYCEPKNAFSAPSELENCKVVHINHVGRHGSRHSVRTLQLDNLYKIIKKAQKQDALNNQVGTKLITLIENIKALENQNNIGQLTAQGKEEHRGIAERMFKAHPELFKQNSAQKNIIMQSTNIKRTKDSLQAFLGRLTELRPDIKNHTIINTTKHGVCDPTLRFFEACNAYDQYVDKHAYKPAIEQAIWQPEARQVIKNMLLRLFSASFIASMSDQEQRSAVYNIYGLCRLQANINKNNLTHSFCSFFTKNSELEYFSWEEDALNYFSKGYAGSENNVAHNVACALVGNFIATSDEAIKSPKTAPIAHLRFAHAETIIPFLVQLGLYSSDSVSTMLQNASERKFRTTEISPMAANVQWILYQCPNNNYRVQMLHNEVAKSFPMPGCESKTSCDYRLVKNYLEQQKLSCDAERWANEVCKGVSCTR